MTLLSGHLEVRCVNCSRKGMTIHGMHGWRLLTGNPEEWLCPTCLSRMMTFLFKLWQKGGASDGSDYTD